MSCLSPDLADLEHLAQQAGRILSEYYEKELWVDFKGEIDLVTEADRRSEAFLIEEISRRFPGHTIMAEEAGGRNDGECQWYIDPLDGTVNYAHGVPIFCVSLAYARAGQLELAAIYDPMRCELFSAARGRGAWLNGRRLRVSDETQLERTLLVTGFPYDTWHTPRNNFDNFAHLARMTQGVRRLGSAALDLCYVAAGRFDGYWELSLKPWDIAAGALICQEAGALVTRTDGAPDLLTEPTSILAANPVLHAKILAELITR
ncbi:MAG: inositol monophosphatase [Anaerolineales bacterium]|nr:inositol monophosphatase [Anaerolineales bacterium]MCX7608993.1 inositol monophosphatase [Anaerolineales bacterium]MDW8227635.1 inositol monophosphatase family protein [Anaerolineales bacterium]